jgi:hypothetical protein
MMGTDRGGHSIHTMSAPRFIAERPRVSAELPEAGERFEGLLPPVVAAPAFAIRRPAVAVFTLDDCAGDGIMLAGQAARRAAVADRKNNPGRRRHIDRQDQAHQRPPGGSASYVERPDRQCGGMIRLGRCSHMSGLSMRACDRWP